MSVKKIAVGLFCLAVMTAGIAEAKKLKVKNLPVDLPGERTLAIRETPEFVQLTAHLRRVLETC